MPMNKYIGTKDVVRLTGLTIEEVYDLIHKGTLPAHKAPKSGWRILYQAVVDSGLIKEKAKPVIEKPQIESGISFVVDEEHYTQVFKRMKEVKRSLKIATGDLKNFNVHVEANGTNETLRICDFFLSLVERGVHVQVVCMKPFGFYLYTKENCPQLLENPLFELRYNEHNHMKEFIFDDECAYIGSANITSAAIGKRAKKKRNHEAGMLLQGASVLDVPLRQFNAVWDDPDALKHTWKRFETKAKEFEREFKTK